MQRLTVLVLLVMQTMIALADEGMWLPIWLQSRDIEKMQKLGLEVPFDELYHQNTPSLKDAIVALDNGSCTAGLVSADGLLLTNHHCGMDNIQSHSSLANDYIKDGFWASDKSEELMNPGKTATILIRATEITHLFTPHLKPASDEAQRKAMIDSLSAVFEASVSDTSRYDAKIVSFYKQNRFVLFLTQTFKDVRLVGTPPVGIGNFGGETDNWVWPRHTGDFCIYRIYTAPDGSPAEYSTFNVPYHPRKFLKISLKGISNGDFTMIMGYPGSTNRYATSAYISTVYESVNPYMNEIRKIKQDILKAEMKRSPDIAIKYAAKYDHSANYQKYALGQNEAIKRFKLIEWREKNEAAIKTQLQSNRDTAFIKEFDALINSYYLIKPIAKANTLIEETLFQGSDLVQFTFKYLNGLFDLRQTSPTDSAYPEKRKDLIEMVNTTFKDYEVNVDKKVMIAMLNYLANNNKPGDIKLEVIPKKFKNNVNNYTTWLYGSTVFTNKDVLVEMITGKISKKLMKDPMIQMIGSIFSQYSPLADAIQSFDNQQDSMGRSLFEKLTALYPDSSFYPDANSTMRLTYGQIKPYSVRDAVEYNWFTTIDGVIEKGKTEQAEFVVPKQQKQLCSIKDFGCYGNNGTLHTCFITTNDITGGNSGSPVMNSKGELIGLAFDSNWEAMTSDLAYNIDYQRTICVDIRYVLWCIDKIGNATHLIHEMEIVE